MKEGYKEQTEGADRNERQCPYFLSAGQLCALFEQTEALKDFLAEPSNDQLRHRYLKDAMVTELFDPLPKPANLASGWALSHKADVALQEILQAHGLLPTAELPTIWERVRSALRR